MVDGRNLFRREAEGCGSSRGGKSPSEVSRLAEARMLRSDLRCDAPEGGEAGVGLYGTELPQLLLAESRVGDFKPHRSALMLKLAS
mmetsp:Transcript_15555/g.33853  ORF Transcript_15555/g.33853 Transcript_15555/m.33853 type:complete len:86 (-) Transcript_15555:414-671(-)